WFRQAGDYATSDSHQSCDATYEIYPGSVRIGSVSKRGYQLKDFVDAWERHPPIRDEEEASAPPSPQNGLTPLTSSTPPVKPVAPVKGAKDLPSCRVVSDPHEIFADNQIESIRALTKEELLDRCLTSYYAKWPKSAR